MQPLLLAKLSEKYGLLQAVWNPGKGSCHRDRETFSYHCLCFGLLQIKGLDAAKKEIADIMSKAMAAAKKEGGCRVHKEGAQSVRHIR